MKTPRISKRKLWKILTTEPPQQIQPTPISSQETSQEDWLKGYWRWKKQHKA